MPGTSSLPVASAPKIKVSLGQGEKPRVKVLMGSIPFKKDPEMME
jgi:hypothetical protein